MKTIYISILVFTLSAAGCSAMLDFKDYTDPNPNCGNGIVDPDDDEECDEGENNSDVTPNACREDCRLPRCGDGVTDTDIGEICDSGADNGQPERCNTTCDGYVPGENCGNGDVDDGEACDDGAELNGGYGQCAYDCSGPGPYCGDGMMYEDLEQCDGEDFGGLLCQDLGFDSGDLECSANCQSDTSGCVGTAGCHVVQELACGAASLTASTADPDSRLTSVGYCDTYGVNHTGREMVYRFVSPIQQQVVVDLSDLSADLDVFILPDDGTMCQAIACVAASIRATTADEHLSFIAQAGQAYFIVIDGYLVDTGTFTLQLNCLTPEDCTNGLDDNGNNLIDCLDADCVGHAICMAEEVNCTDGLDNDGDNTTDCMDPDCSTSGACDCAVAETVNCGDVFTSSNYGPGSTNRLTGGWCMSSAATYQGPERVYQLNPPANPPNAVTFSITSLTADVDVFVLNSTDGICHSGACTAGAASATPELADEVVTFPYVDGTDYFFAVDGWQWAKGEYQVEILCN